VADGFAATNKIVRSGSELCVGDRTVLRFHCEVLSPDIGRAYLYRLAGRYQLLGRQRGG